MQRATAQRVSEIVLRYSHELNAAIRAVKRTETSTDLLRLRRGIGEVLGLALTEVLHPLYAEHPDLSPPELRHLYPVTKKKNESTSKPRRVSARKK